MNGDVAESPLRVRFGPGKPVPLYPEECEPHTPAPSGYVAWWSWADEMGPDHDQRQCKGCGLWAIWYPRPGASGGGGSGRALPLV